MKKGNVTILASILAIALVSVVFGASTMAYFSDIKTSSGNTFTAGTLNLDGTNMATFTFGAIDNMAPEDKTDMAVITVKNGGSIDAATFGRFTLTGDTGLAEVLKFYEYKVEYYKANDDPVARWGATDYDPYFGTAINMDYWVKVGVMHSTFVSYGGEDNLRDWVDGNGALDIPGASWDMEGLKPGCYYVLSVRFQMDPNADDAYQGKTVTLGYEVVATQINRGAILLLDLGGNMSSAVDSHVDYLLSQLLLQ